MKRKLIPFFLAGTFVAWLIGSYLPQGVVPWRTIPGEGMDDFLRIAVAVSALLFVAIQVILVASVFKFPQRISRHDSYASPEPRQFQGQEESQAVDSSSLESGEIVIKRRWELLWTVTPLVASLALFVVSYWVLSG